jgi:hypothetical protein
MKSIKDIELKYLVENKEFTKSPIDWENQIIYFLLVDRFSDGQEENYQIYNPNKDYENIFTEGDSNQWEAAANQWNGGTL